MTNQKKKAFAEGATHVENSNSCRRIAFTLAEVLITLGIIGIVAAVTMPTLISNYRKDKTINQLKQAYSQFQQATQMAISDSGLEPEYWLSEAELSLSQADKIEIVYERYIKPYMNTSNFDKSKGTFYDSKGRKYTLGNAHASSSLWVPHSTNPWLANLSVDLDGDKGKNQLGYDKFIFIYQRRGKSSSIVYVNTKLTHGFLSCGVPSYFSIEEYFDYAYNNSGTYPGCGSNQKSCCGDIIMREGWKITDNYPVKF